MSTKNTFFSPTACECGCHSRFIKSNKCYACERKRIAAERAEREESQKKEYTIYYEDGRVIKVYAPAGYVERYFVKPTGKFTKNPSAHGLGMMPC